MQKKEYTYTYDTSLLIFSDILSKFDSDTSYAVIEEPSCKSSLLIKENILKLLDPELRPYFYTIEGTAPKWYKSSTPLEILEKELDKTIINDRLEFYDIPHKNVICVAVKGRSYLCIRLISFLKINQSYDFLQGTRDVGSINEWKIFRADTEEVCRKIENTIRLYLLKTVTIKEFTYNK